MVLPDLSGSREAARRLISTLDEVENCVVIVDASLAVSTAPSFVDELCKVLLVELSAAEVRIIDAPEKLRFYAQRSVDQREVSAKLVFI